MRRLKKKSQGLKELREIAEGLLIGTGALDICHDHETLIDAGKPASRSSLSLRNHWVAISPQPAQ